MTQGYFTVTDLMNLKVLSDSQRIESDRLQDLITTDLRSQFKRDMSTSVDYYNSEHDILTATREYLRDGVLQVNKGKANNRIPHPFHKVLIDEKTAYITGNPITIGIAGEDKGEAEAKSYREKLINILTEEFDDVMADWVAGASKKAVEWVHFFINPEGEFEYIIVPAEQIIAIYDAQYEDKLRMAIRFYEFVYVKPNGLQEIRYKVERWNENEIEYWTQIEEERFVLDVTVQVNPSAHWYTFNTMSPSKRSPHSWGRVPFVPLWNNSEHKNDLAPIKPLIDAYDKVKCGWANDLADFAEVLYVVKGFNGLSSEAQPGLTELAALIKNIKEDGAVAVDVDGAVQVIKAEIPVEAKEKFLDITGREIIYFGEGSDVTADVMNKSHAPSGVALQFLYARLDMKCNRLIRKMKSSLKEFMWFTTEWINQKENTKFDYNKVTFTVNKSQIFNEAEKIQSLVSSGEMLSMETKLEQHPFVDDVQGEMERLKREKARDVVPPPPVKPTIEPMIDDLNQPK